MSDQLLPCPFCGHNTYYTTGVEENAIIYVACHNGKCPIYEKFMRENDWNTRPDSKQYKWEDYDEWWSQPDSLDVSRKAVFIAAREIKE